MNLANYFSKKPINEILKHYNTIYNVREVANTRVDKLKALSQQVEMLNIMNKDGGVKLEIPHDFIQHFLDDKV